MKRMKQAGGCKDQEELDEDNEELFAELGIKPWFHMQLLLAIIASNTLSI